MAGIKLLKEPGFIDDLMFLFYLKFNFKSYLNQLDKELRQPEDIDFFRSVSSSFGSIPEDLYIFFHAPDRPAFLTIYYFDTYKPLFTTTYNFEFLQNELNDQDKLIKNMIRFYFPDLTEDELESTSESKEKLFALIKNSKYTGEERIRLYEFFFDPRPYILLLQSELNEKRPLLKQYYEKNYEKIIDAHSQIDINTLSQQFKCINEEWRNINEQDFYISYCLLNKYHICTASGAGCILGNEYLSAMDIMVRNQKDIDFIAFGSVFDDVNRVGILDLLLERGEITRKDLERKLSISGTTAYHHITTLVNSGALNIRNEGKTMYYSLNHEYFKAAVVALQKYL